MSQPPSNIDLAERLTSAHSGFSTALLMAMGEAVISIDHNGKIILFNRAAEEVFGYEAATIYGEPLEILLPETSRAGHDELVQGFAEGSETKRFMGGRPAIRGRRRDGSEFQAEAALSRIKQDGHVIFTAILRDISESEEDKAEIRQQNMLLTGLSNAQQDFIAGKNPDLIFDEMLELLLNLTQSEYGFLGIIEHDADGPYLRTKALSDISWDEASNQIYQVAKTEGAEFHNLETLFGRIITTKEVVFSDDPPNDPRSGGLPGGHPPLNAFLGLPIMRGNDIVAAAGLSNRPGGYDKAIVEVVKPLLATFGTLIDAYATSLERIKTERALQVSENRIRLLFRSSPIGLALNTLDGRFLEINDAFHEMLGFSEAELMQRSINQITPDEFLKNDREMFVNFRLSGSYGPYEKEMIAKDGTIIPVKLHGTLLMIDNEDVIWSTIQDLREEKRTETVELSLANAQRIAKIGNWDWNILTGELWWSDEIYRMFGRTPQSFDATYEAFTQTIHPDDRASVQAAVDLAVADQKDYNIRHRIMQLDGAIRVVQEEGEVTFDETGTATRMTGTVQDITDRVKTENQLQQAQKMEIVGQLTGGLAHDFNNLLGVILGNLDLLGTRKLDEQSRVLIERCMNAGERGADLINHLLAFSRQQPLHPVDLELSTAIADADSMFGHALGQNIKIVTQVAHDTGICRVDKAQLESVILNLCLNARDAMNGSGTITISAKNVDHCDVACFDGRIVEDRPYVRMSIADTGSGMDDNVMRQVFEPFFTTKGHGSGLGLSMVHGFIQSSDGHINIVSAAGKGTRVDIYLQQVDAKDSVQQITHDAADFSVIGLNLRALVVEDHRDVRDLSVQVMQKIGFEVIEAASGEAALELLKDIPHIDVLFSDIILKDGMSGTELTQKVLADRPDVKVVLTSGFSEREMIRKMLGIPHEFLPKPYKISGLKEALSRLLEDKTGGLK